MTESVMKVIDGREALASVLIVPGTTPETVAVEAHANGIDKLQAAKVLMTVARMWKEEAEGAEHHG